jgi:hypothetical protein
MRWLVALLLAATPPAMAAEPPPDLVLEGVIEGRDHERYLERPFAVPADAIALEVRFQYDRTTRTVIDLGLLEAGRFRGWSGGSKARFLVGETIATPSFLPGPVAGREMTLLLGVPNARQGSRTPWQAAIRFHRRGASPILEAEPPRAGPGWFRGDFHAHSGHSDGTCPNDAGQRVPCPVARTVDAARSAGLHFLALTEHNTVSHLSELLAQQLASPSLLLLPGQEVTTFAGHANVIGPMEPAPFRIGSAAVPDAAAWQHQVGRLRGLVSVNHPALPSGEACMGCGWALAGTDWSRIDAIEVVNGGAVAAAGGRVESPVSGIPFWEQRLSEGHRLTAIGGSDNHDPTLRSPDPRAIGRIVTVVWADALSTPAILEGVRRGRVFLDLDGIGRSLDMSAKTGSSSIAMGGDMASPPGGSLRLRLLVKGCQGCRAEVRANGAAVAEGAILTTDAVVELPVRADPGWLRADVRTAEGRLVLIGNPIYIRHP